MKSIVKLAVFAAIVYVAVIYGRPWIEEILGGVGVGELGDGDPPRACIAAIERANESFSQAVIEHSRPPVDTARWSAAYKMSEGRLRKSEVTCDCQEQGCAEARQALAELRDLMTTTNRELRSNRPPQNVAQRQQRINELLIDAESVIP